MVTTAALLGSIGVNTHFDYGAAPVYNDIAQAIKAINYIGVKRIRDCAQKTTTPKIWHAVMNGTGAHFLAYLPEGSIAAVQKAFDLLPATCLEGVVALVEGPNEEDDADPVAQGDSALLAKAFLVEKLAPWARDPNHNKPIVNISFGAGWTAENGWKGDYDKVGDLSGSCDYANAHTYPLPTQKTTATMIRLNELANIAAPDRPVVTSEIGWKGTDLPEAEIAKRVIQACFTGATHNAAVYFYALYDDKSGKFGLMHDDGTPRQAGTALHNLTTILKPSLLRTAPQSTQAYSTYDRLKTDIVVEMYGADGSLWLAIWNEVETTTHEVTFGFGSPAVIALFDPLTSPLPVTVYHSMITRVVVTSKVALLKVA